MPTDLRTDKVEFLANGNLRLVLGWGCGVHAFSVEDECLGFGFGALGRKFFAVPEEAYAGGVSYSYDQFAGSVEACGGGSDQGFLGERLSVGGNGDP